MTSERFHAVTSRYAKLRVAVVGDFCLDRYLEIDPEKAEISIETNLPVHNVVRVRAQPGAAGTILNNLVALGVNEIFPVGFCGEDGEGFELKRALVALAGVSMDGFVTTPQRRTFTYCKPLVFEPGRPPQELNRLDCKNWIPTPKPVQQQIVDALRRIATRVDAIIMMDQVDVPETGVVTRAVLDAMEEFLKKHPQLTVLADSRRGLKDFPPVIFKMNAAELIALTGTSRKLDLPEVRQATATLAHRNQRPVFVTLAERGILGAAPDGQVEHVSALPVRGETDIVGAGDSVTANLTAALAAGASLRESIELANSAASTVIHKLGTTGTATVEEIRGVLKL